MTAQDVAQVPRAISTRGWIPGYMVFAGGRRWLLHEGEWYAIDTAVAPLPAEPKR